MVENKYKLLKPILSRFCEIYISLPIYAGKEINFINLIFQKPLIFQIGNTRSEYLKNQFTKFQNK